jgi:hypothetical protein
MTFTILIVAAAGGLIAPLILWAAEQHRRLRDSG